MSETEIITRVLSGESQLFANIVNRYTGFVWALCSSYIPNRADCEDLTQEIFVQCYRNLNTLRNPAAFAGWLSRLARRQCLMWLRADTRRNQRLTRYGQGLERTHARIREAQVDQPAHQELLVEVRNAIDALPPDYREALLLRFMEGYSVEEAAQFLGVSPAAMRKRIERAQAALKDRLWDEVEPALAKARHKKDLTRGILAAIPFNSAPWLNTVTTGAAVSKAAMLGGITIMSKKLVFGIAAALLVLGLGVVSVEKFKPAAPQTPVATQTPAVTTAPTIPAPANDPAPAQAPSPVLPAPQAAPLPVSAETKSAPKSAPAPKPASVSGLVSDTERHPLSGADVYLEIGRDPYTNDVAKKYHTKTGADGKFAISGVKTFGAAKVFASADGYVMTRDGVEISAGKTLKDLNLTLQQARFYVAGRVVTVNGIPIPDASVDTLYYGYDERGLAHTAATGQTTGTISSSKFLFATTDQDGHFKVAIPSKGLCDLRVMKADYAPGFFPQVATGTENAVFTLRSGGAISGKVTDTSGRPVAGVAVQVTGEALPGGLAPSSVRIQTIALPPITVTTNAHGNYRADKLGDAYIYTVTVPTPERPQDATPAKDSARSNIVDAMRELDDDVFGAQAFGARKTGVIVKAGQTTPDVNLVLGSIRPAIIRGVVTDRTTGNPVCPIVVTAGSVDSGADSAAPRYWFQAKFGGSAVTKSDGSYELRIQNLTTTHDFRISHAFMTEGGSAWSQPHDQAALLTLSPGDQRTLNFTVDAPVTVPVRYVDTSGAPVEGISAAIREAGGRGGCGGVLSSDANGRVTFHGIRPFVDLQAIAWKMNGVSPKTIGVSAPFSGQPGQTIPEVTVVCHAMGGIEATLVYPDGRAVANTTVRVEAQLAHSAAPPVQDSVTTDANGGARVPGGILAALYQDVHVHLLDPQSAQAFSATVTNVTVAAGTVTNVGTIRVEPEKDWTTVLKAADWGHKGNETIAAMYAKGDLDQLSNPTLILKAGFAFYDVGNYRQALDAFTKLEQVSQNNNRTMTAVALIWQGQMLDLLGRRSDAVAAYTTAANMNVTSTMSHDQFGMTYVPSDYARERIHQPFTRVENRMP